MIPYPFYVVCFLKRKEREVVNVHEYKRCLKTGIVKRNSFFVLYIGSRRVLSNVNFYFHAFWGRKGVVVRCCLVFFSMVQSLA